MNIWKRVGIVAVCIAVIVGAVWLCFGDKISLIYTSLNSFKDENLAHTFQHTPEIQPTVKIGRSETPFQFLKEDNAALAEGFQFAGEFYPTEPFMKDTKTSAMLVVKDDVIRYENYFFGGDETTVFSSNSMGKSFVSALMGIAVSEGAIDSVDDPLGKYIPEFVGTELENIPIRACLQMASGIDFDEDTDMSGFSLRTLMGMPAMKVIAKYGVQEAPYTYRRYLSINTEILGQVIKNATGQGLGAYMEEKLWKRIGSEHDAYWTLSNGTELANGGLSISLRDYARFARLYLNEGSYDGQQILPREWVRDSLDVSADYSKPGANNDGYNAIGYGYQWWVPEGEQGEFMAIGVYGQFIYVNPTSRVIIVKVNADPNFMSENYELKHVAFFRTIAEGLG
ncbi:serine hydrolase [Intestinimonas sp.]|uniref:serine hydrolase domain-containing protein n=1 Tax=Intestinimonas sp. TaxID=1965293 RepID=UPI002603C4FA|nr:serine hydrolase [Intestinimonas sp.]